MEKENDKEVDRIVFCVFQDKDWEIYEKLGPEVFSREHNKLRGERR